MRKSVLTAGLLGLAACQTQSGFVVYKPGMSEAQTQLAVDQCRIASLREIPQAMSTELSGGVYNPGSTYCSTVGTTVTCNQVGGVNIPPRATTYDANAELRGRYINRCLQAKGYQLISAPRCASAAAAAKSAAEMDAGRPPTCGEVSL
jgi:putative hemolysin